MLLGAVTPLVLTELEDLPSALVGTLVLLSGTVLFFASLRGLHRQMAAVKERELNRARSLYRQAYQPLQQDPSLPVLQQQAGLLGAAESLEKRAAQIQGWPFDEATFRPDGHHRLQRRGHDHRAAVTGSDRPVALAARLRMCQSCR